MFLFLPMFPFCKKMRYKLLSLISKLQYRKSFLVGFWPRLLLGNLYLLARAFLYFLVGLVSLPVFATKRTYESFQILARRNGSGEYIDSYHQHTILQRISIIVLLLVVILIVIKLISLFTFSLYAINP